MENSDVPCGCPDWWFPPDKRAVLSAFPENYCGALAHHPDCPKKKFPVDASYRFPKNFWERIMDPSQ